MPDLNNALSRHGERVPVYEEAVQSENRFGQPDTDWEETDTVLCMRSYQNRNTSTSSSSGELHNDRAVFFFPKSNAPPADARIEYKGTYFELDSPTPQLTHTVAVGSHVIDEEFNP